MKSPEQRAHDELEQLVRDTRDLILQIRKSGMLVPYRVAIDCEAVLKQVEAVSGIGNALSTVTSMIRRLHPPQSSAHDAAHSEKA